jgi:crotonobetainyl-CoA:carnitine CoA-transferase CaiB-like acyl-CoA transferase
MEEKKCLARSPRVLDLTNNNGYLCGRILADLGADVIKIEKPGGDPDSASVPFITKLRSGKSLVWLAYNANKRGITLKLDSADGQQILKALANNADFWSNHSRRDTWMHWGLDTPISINSIPA